MVQSLYENNSLIRHSVQITKVHLNNSGNIVIVDLQPTLDEITQAKNDMPYWRNWQMVCLEVCCLHYYHSLSSLTGLGKAFIGQCRL